MSFALSDCARARESVSVQLDGELPELELDRLETHLRFCPACAAWAENVRDVTRRLREAAFEEPAEVFALPRRSRRWAVSSAVALASAAAVVATLFVAPGRQNASLGALNRPRSLATYDVATQPHPVDFLIPGASSSVTAQWPVRPL